VLHHGFTGLAARKLAADEWFESIADEKRTSSCHERRQIKTFADRVFRDLDLVSRG
jgi:hypothetical protein